MYCFLNCCSSNSRAGSACWTVDDQLGSKQKTGDGGDRSGAESCAKVKTKKKKELNCFLFFLSVHKSILERGLVSECVLRMFVFLFSYKSSMVS